MCLLIADNIFLILYRYVAMLEHIKAYLMRPVTEIFPHILLQAAYERFIAFTGNHSQQIYIMYIHIAVITSRPVHAIAGLVNTQAHAAPHFLPLLYITA